MDKSLLFPAIVFTSLILVVFAFFLIGFLVVHKSRQARARSKLAAYETQLLQTRIEVQEAAAKSISAELHDNIGGILSHIKMQLQFLTEADEGQDLRPELKPLYEDLSGAITDLRGISHSLNGDMIGRTGLAAALRKELDGIQRRGKLATSLRIDEELRLTPSQELLLFRIAQEAITNVLKHAGATKLGVSLRREGQALMLNIEDNGRGMVAGTDAQGMGIMNMGERARMLGGELQVKSAAGGGIILSISIPQQ